MSHEESRKEKLNIVYDMFGLGADICQLSRAYLRGEKKGMSKNISQMITKLEKIRKRI